MSVVQDNSSDVSHRIVPEFRFWSDRLVSDTKENDYRIWALDSDKRLINGFINLAILGIIAFFIIDISSFTVDLKSSGVLLLRIAILGVLINTHIRLKNPISRKELHLISGLLFISICVLNVIVVQSLPTDYFNHLAVETMIILLCYLATPLPITYKLAINALFSLSLIGGLLFIKEPTYSSTYYDYPFSLLLANILGYWVSIHHGRVRRESYYHLLNEKKAFEEIQTLRGIIPICSYCKKIRDDQGSWSKLEAYLSEHSDAKFSHGICPDCVSNWKNI